MQRSAGLHLHRGGPFVHAVCATLVYLPASVWVPRVSPARLRPPRFPLRASLPFSPRVPRALEKLAARPLEPQQPRTMLFHGSAARRDLNLDNLTCTNWRELCSSRAYSGAPGKGTVDPFRAFPAFLARCNCTFQWEVVGLVDLAGF